MSILHTPETASHVGVSCNATGEPSFLSCRRSALYSSLVSTGLPILKRLLASRYRISSLEYVMMRLSENSRATLSCSYLLAVRTSLPPSL